MIQYDFAIWGYSIAYIVTNWWTSAQNDLNKIEILLNAENCAESSCENDHNYEMFELQILKFTNIYGKSLNFRNFFEKINLNLFKKKTIFFHFHKFYDCFAFIHGDKHKPRYFANEPFNQLSVYS